MRSPNRQLPPSRVFRRVPLRLVLVVPFVAQIMLAVGLTGWFSLRNGQKAVNDLAAQLRNKTTSQVTHLLEERLLLPHQINQLNLHAIANGTLDLQNFEQMGKTFYRQMQVFDVGYINFANEEGEFIGVERLEDGTLLINETRKDSLYTMSIYTTDEQGNRISAEVIGAPADVTEEGWYAAAAQARKPVWSEIYPWDDKPDVLSVSSSYPVYNRRQQLLGVIGVDLILSDFNRFLQDLQPSPSAKVFIIERNGLLVASSDPEPPFVLSSNEAQRMNVSQSHNPLVKATVRYLITHFSNLSQIQASQQLNFRMAGQQQFVQVTPWRDRHGLDWLVIVVVPESDFMEQITDNTRTTILLCLLSLALAILFGLITSGWIIQWIQRLVKVSQEIADGKLDQTVDVQGIKELEDLSHSFNQMAAQLKAAFTELEDRVAQRTAELYEAKNAAEAASRAKSEFLEAMSHELRTPLNAILGVAQVFQHDPSLPSEYQERLKITHRNGNYLLALINDLLEIAKIGLDQAPSSQNRFDRELQFKPGTISQSCEEVVDQRLVEYLTQMPPEWVHQLQQAAIKGFDREIFQLVTHIPGDLEPLAVSLIAWVKDFRFDRVTDLIQSMENQRSHH